MVLDCNDLRLAAHFSGSSFKTCQLHMSSEFFGWCSLLAFVGVRALLAGGELVSVLNHADD